MVAKCIQKNVKSTPNYPAPQTALLLINITTFEVRLKTILMEQLILINNIKTSKLMAINDLDYMKLQN